MTIQARMSAEDRRLYNPSRDVAHNFSEVLNLVAGRLEDAQWKELQAILDQHEITLDDLGDACGAYCQYIVSAKDDPNLPMTSALEQAGFLSTKPMAQVAFMAMLGVCYAGIQFVGVREATLGNEGPLYTVKDLLAHSERLHKHLGLPRWRRKWLRLKQKLINGLRAFRS